RVAVSRTTTKNHGSAPRAEGARVAAERMRRTAASGTGSGRKRRSARWVSTTVKKSSGATPAAAPRRAWSPPPSRTAHAYGRSTWLDKPRQPRVSRLLARRLERGLDLRRAEPVPVGEEAAALRPELERIAQERLGAQDTQPLPPRGDEAARVLVEGSLQEAQRQRLPLEIVGGQVADQLARPVQQGRAATEQRQRGRQEERFGSHSPTSCRSPGPALRSYFLLLPSTVALKVLATEKPTFLRAGILIGSPVCGLRPMRAFILR